MRQQYSMFIFALALSAITTSSWAASGTGAAAKACSTNAPATGSVAKGSGGAVDVVYKTKDGCEFTSEAEANAHAAILAESGGGSAAPIGSGAAAFYQTRYLRENGIAYQNEADKHPPATTRVDPCDPQRLFIRANSLDDYLYGITPASKANGASISYTGNALTHIDTLAVQGMISYVALRSLCPNTPPGDPAFVSGYSFAPFVYAAGSFNDPPSAKERSVFKAGFEDEFELSNAGLPRQVFTVSPYIQSDFRGKARIGGGSAYWDPYDADLHLGGYVTGDPYLGWFWQFRGVADIQDVQDPGLTGLKQGVSTWIGAQARLNVTLFPLATTVPSFLQNRLSFIGEYDYFQDLSQGRTAALLDATLKYNLDEKGTTALGLEYKNGTDKDTLTKQEQYLLKLLVSY